MGFEEAIDQCLIELIVKVYPSMCQVADRNLVLRLIASGYNIRTRSYASTKPTAW